LFVACILGVLWRPILAGVLYGVVRVGYWLFSQYRIEDHRTQVPLCVTPTSGTSVRYAVTRVSRTADTRPSQHNAQ
jgi:hypothetical protein